jgi:hypothetical protein
MEEINPFRNCFVCNFQYDFGIVLIGLCDQSTNNFVDFDLLEKLCMVYSNVT